MARLLFVVLLFLGAAAQAARPDAKSTEAFEALTQMDARLATVGYRLAAANAPYCTAKFRNPGWVLHGIGQYEDEKAARAAFSFAHGAVAIAALVPDGPAAKAGLRVGDGLNDIPGTKWDRRMHVLPGSGRDDMEALRQMLAETWRAKPAISMTFASAQGPLELALAPQPICASDFWVDTRDKVDAGADGERVRLTVGIMNYVADDHELAAVVAHEMAHNLLDHRMRLNGLKRGKTRATYATEVEADQLSVWLMANAGYDVAAVLRFAERYGRQFGLGIFADGTHPRWKKRVASMRAEIETMALVPATNGLRAPPLLAAAQ